MLAGPPSGYKLFTLPALKSREFVGTDSGVLKYIKA